MGDETTELHGTNYLKTLPPATGFTKEEIEARLKNIKLPSGFKIELWASGVTDARQMAWGDKGTLFVGSLFGGGGVVHAVVDEGGKRVVKDAIKGLKFPSGIAFRNGALYVADVNKTLKYDKTEDHIGDEPAPTVVYDDMPPGTALCRLHRHPERWTINFPHKHARRGADMAEQRMERRLAAVLAASSLAPDTQRCRSSP